MHVKMPQQFQLNQYRESSRVLHKYFPIVKKVTLKTNRAISVCYQNSVSAIVQGLFGVIPHEVPFKG